MMKKIKNENILDSKKAINDLKYLFLENNKKKYPSLPDYARAVPKYKDNTTNGLTKCIKDYVTFKGFHIERTGNQGRIIDNRKIVTDCVGFQRNIGSIQRIKSSSQRGTSDLKAIINGKFIAIEVKCLATKDRQSEYQKEYQKQVEASGGIYVIASTFLQFYEWFNEFISNEK